MNIGDRQTIGRDIYNEPFNNDKCYLINIVNVHIPNYTKLIII